MGVVITPDVLAYLTPIVKLISVGTELITQRDFELLNTFVVLTTDFENTVCLL